jgi:hypothetical protein
MVHKTERWNKILLIVLPFVDYCWMYIPCVWIKSTMTPWLGNAVLLYCVEEMRYIYLMLLCFVGHALIDLLMRSIESPPQVGQKVLCRHPFQESKRAYVIPSRVESLYKVCLIQTAWLFYLTNISVVAWCTYRSFNWINQPAAATSQVHYLSFKYTSTCFGHPHAHHQKLQQLQ